MEASTTGGRPDWTRDLGPLKVPAVTVDSHIAERAVETPDAVALIYYGRSLTYGALNAAVERLAGFLQRRRGVVKGDRVLLVLQNSPQFVIAYYAILRADAVVVPGNPMNRSAELAHYLDDSGARVAIVGEELAEILAPLVGQGSLRHLILGRYGDYADPDSDIPLPETLRSPASPPEGDAVTAWQDALILDLRPGPQQAQADDLAVIPYSSGTTGAPKGCMHSHRTVMTTVIGGIAWNPGSDGHAIHLISLPLFHVTGMQNGMNAPLYQGHTLVLMSRWDRRSAARLIERHRIARWRNITTMVIDLLGDPDLAAYDLSSLEGIGGGGAAMPDAVFDALRARTGLSYVEGYGLTETMAATHINPPDRPRRKCLGLPVFEVDARIRDPDSGDLLGVDRPGEIVIHAPQVFLGYWNDPEATEAAFVEIEGKRFFRTGDIGRVDADGFFYMVDRIKRMINLSGFKVWPAEVELLLHRHPAVAEACVIATRDSRRGESVKALLVPAEGAVRPSDADIMDWCRERLSAYKVPRALAWVESLPRSGTGKVDWRALQAREEEGTSDA
ncbi:MAG: long-chain fatty acid--CoA ligase [Rhodospirillales bacterium]